MRVVLIDGIRYKLQLFMRLELAALEIDPFSANSNRYEKQIREIAGALSMLLIPTGGLRAFFDDVVIPRYACP